MLWQRIGQEPHVSGPLRKASAESLLEIFDAQFPVQKRWIMELPGRTDLARGLRLEIVNGQLFLE